MDKPVLKPNNPCFSSGPCAKFPGYNLNNIPTYLIGRSHRSKIGKQRLQLSIDKSRKLLGLPDDYLIGIVPASDTGAFEMAMWSLLGPRGVDVFYWDSFGKGWAVDAEKQLKLDDIRIFHSPYGELPDLTQADFSRDIIFTWNGTTSGVMVPNGDWISDDNRQGLVICDATSAVFAMDIPWQKIDVITYSWQKVLGSEAAHGMLILSPRAVQRLENYTPAWPLPKIFRLTKNSQLIDSIFSGSTINTPSMLANEDHLLALDWVETQGGVEKLMERSKQNLSYFEEFVNANDWIHFLAKTKDIRSHTSICLTIDLEPDKVKQIVQILADENVALDCASYRDAPPGLRFWGGGTVEPEDVKKLLPWIKWAFFQVK